MDQRALSAYGWGVQADPHHSLLALWCPSGDSPQGNFIRWVVLCRGGRLK